MCLSSLAFCPCPRTSYPKTPFGPSGRSENSRALWQLLRTKHLPWLVRLEWASFWRWWWIQWTIISLHDFTTDMIACLSVCHQVSRLLYYILVSPRSVELLNICHFLTDDIFCLYNLFRKLSQLHFFGEASKPQSPAGNGIPRRMVVQQGKAVALSLLSTVSIIARLGGIL